VPLKLLKVKTRVFTKGKVFLQQLAVSTRQLTNDRRITKFGREVARTELPADQKAPILVFNASTRITGLSQNAAFSLLTAWALRLSGQPVCYFVCSQGMSACVLGTNRDDVWREPPCKRCIEQSQRLYDHGKVEYFSYESDLALHASIETMNIQQLAVFTYKGLPLGELVLPSIRWVLRRHHLFDDHNTKHLYRQFILSAWNVSRRFEELIRHVKPAAVLVFNGMFFPEAAVRAVALKHDIRVITHEAGIRNFSGFFTDGEATAYPVAIPSSFKLSKAQDQRLDAYLAQRFEGRFSMADVQFWPSMEVLSEQLLEDIDHFHQLVPIFTNVIFDTSQPHSNLIYPDMFTWLDSLLPVIRKYPKTLFVIRAHPDETRPGKTSQETVADWAAHRSIQDFKNVRFIGPEQNLSSYDLIKKSKFILVYNSTIGLEASIMGIPVLSAGRARFTQYQTVYFPKTRTAYLKKLDDFLKIKKLKPLPVHRTQARRFLYYQLFRTSLSFEKYLEADGIWRGFVRLTDIKPEDLGVDNSETMRILIEGFQKNKPFLSAE
jgi:hypothetical protein